MPANNKDLIITSLETIDAFDLEDKYLWTLDELTATNIQNSEDSEDVTGKAGRLLATLKRNKTVTISGTNGVISGGLIATQTGGEFKSGSKTVRVTDVITVDTTSGTGNFDSSTDKLTLANSNVFVVKQTANDGTETEFTLDTSTGTGVAAGKFKRDNTGITFHDGDVTNGMVLTVLYAKSVTAYSVDNIADGEHWGQMVKIYINAFAEDRCGKIYKIQFVIPKAQFSGTFDIDMGGSQVTHGFEIKSLTGACSALSNKGLLWTYIVFDDNASA